MPNFSVCEKPVTLDHQLTMNAYVADLTRTVTFQLHLSPFLCGMGGGGGGGGILVTDLILSRPGNCSSLLSDRFRYPPHRLPKLKYTAAQLVLKGAISYHITPDLQIDLIRSHLQTTNVKPPLYTDHITPDLQIDLIRSLLQTTNATPPLYTDHITPDLQTDLIRSHLQTTNVTPPLYTDHITLDLQTDLIRSHLQTTNVTPPLYTDHITPDLYTN